MSNIINTDNRSNNNIITVTSTNIKMSEKLAESYANSAKRNMQECAAYLSAIQAILAECQSVRDSVNITLSNDLTSHTEDSDNPHNVTAGQVNAYTKTETDNLLSEKVSGNDLSTVATSGAYSDLTGTPTLSAVATSGSYNDLSDKPTISDTQIQSDWEQSDNTAKDYIKNKPTIPTVPTNVSSFTNDAGYTANTGTITGITMNGTSKGTSGVVDLGTVITSHQDISGKQDASTAVTHSASTAVGSSTNPVYIASDGTATATTYTLGKSVPSDAVFTDTTYTFSTGLTESSGTVTVTDYDKLLKNTATGNNSITIGSSYATSSNQATNIGASSKATQDNAIGLGAGAQATASHAIQIGEGTNNTANSLAVSFGVNRQYKLLDGVNGLIPDARISTNIARTSDIPTVNDGVVTISQGGVTKGTFSVNQAGDTTINIDAGSSITIDTELSDTSTNPVQNKAVTAAINSNVLTPGQSISISTVYNNDFSTPTVVTPTEDTVYWQRVRYYDGQYIAVGAESSIYISSNATQWASKYTGHQDISEFYDIAYNGSDLYVAIANNGYIATTSDFQTFTNTQLDSDIYWRHIEYGNGKFIIIGDDGYGNTGYIAIKDGANNWTIDEISGYVMRDIVFDGSRFVAVDHNNIGTSTDGSNWSWGTISGSSLNIDNISYSNGTYVAGVNNGTTVYYSTDLTTWSNSQIGAGFIFRDRITHTEYSNGVCVVVARNTQNSQYSLYVSTNLSGWAKYTTSYSGDVYSLNFCNDKFIIGCDSYMYFYISTSSKVIACTVDNSLNTTSSNPVQNSVVAGAVNTINGNISNIRTNLNSISTDLNDVMATVNNSAIAEGNSISITNSYTNDYDFEIQTDIDPALENDYWANVRYINNKYIALGRTGIIAVSDDTLNWDVSYQGNIGEVTDIAYNGSDLYVAIGSNGYILTSSDLETWTEVQLSQTYYWDSILYANNKFVITGNNFGAWCVAYGDGVNSWTIDPISGHEMNSIIFDGTRFIVADDDSIGTSTDGYTWTWSTISGASGLNKICYDNNKYVATGGSGIIFSSSDLSTWTSFDLFDSFGYQNYEVRIMGYGNGSCIVYAFNILDFSLTMFASSDLENWEECHPQYLDIQDIDILNVDYCNGKFFVCCYYPVMYLYSGNQIKVINCVVDNALSPTSTNPVQNSVIYNAIGDIETLLSQV